MARLAFVDLHLYPNQRRVRVRRASISEPSDTDPELRTLDPSPAGKLTLPAHSLPTSFQTSLISMLPYILASEEKLDFGVVWIIAEGPSVCCLFSLAQREICFQAAFS